MKGKRDEAAYQQAAEALEQLKKKRLCANASEVLICQDEVEIHRHPTLCRMWASIGSQPQVPAPGQNEKRVVYGKVDYATARITYTVAPTKSANQLPDVLDRPAVKPYPGRKIRLVCDNSSAHLGRERVASRSTAGRSRFIGYRHTAQASI